MPFDVSPQPANADALEKRLPTVSGKAVDPMSPVRKGDMQAFTHGQRIGDQSALSLQLCTRLRSAGPELQSRSLPNTLLPNG